MAAAAVGEASAEQDDESDASKGEAGASKRANEAGEKRPLAVLAPQLKLPVPFEAEARLVLDEGGAAPDCTHGVLHCP